MVVVCVSLFTCSPSKQPSHNLFLGMLRRFVFCSIGRNGQVNRCKPHGDLRALSTEGFHRQGEPGKGMRGWRRYLAISHMGMALATGKSLQDVVW